jgi:hypothetical protein
MDELIGGLVADAGVDRSAVEKAVSIILGFLVREGPANDAVAGDTVSAISSLPQLV